MYWWKNSSIQTEQDLRLLFAVDPAGFLQIYCVTRTNLEFLKVHLVLPEVGAVCGVSCCRLCFCIIFRYPDNEISSCRSNAAEVSSLKRDALCNVCWLFVLYARSVYLVLALWTMCSLFVPYTCYVYLTARFLYRMLFLCTICSFSVLHSRSVYHMPVFCTVYLLCAPYFSFSVPYARSVYHMLVFCTVCFFFVPHARSLYRMLVLCTICSFSIPYTLFCTMCSFSVPYTCYVYHTARYNNNNNNSNNIINCNWAVTRCVCVCVCARARVRTICWFCVPYCSFLEPCAYSVYHMLVLCTVWSFYVPHARS
jgi:hypothetical protein